MGPYSALFEETQNAGIDLRRLLQRHKMPYAVDQFGFRSLPNVIQNALHLFFVEAMAAVLLRRPA